MTLFLKKKVKFKSNLKRDKEYESLSSKKFRCIRLSCDTLEFYITEIKMIMYCKNTENFS